MLTIFVTVVEEILLTNNRTVFNRPWLRVGKNEATFLASSAEETGG